MMDEQELNHLIATIYDAALDPSLWTEALEGIAEFVDGRVGGLLVKDSRQKQVDAHWYCGIDPEYMKLYADTYSKLGPVANSPRGTITRPPPAWEHAAMALSTESPNFVISKSRFANFGGRMRSRIAFCCASAESSARKVSAAALVLRKTRLFMQTLSLT